MNKKGKRATTVVALAGFALCVLQLFLPGAANGKQSPAAIQAPAQAQSLSPRAVGAEIILPAELVTQKPGTLAVLDASGALAPGVSVDLSTGVRVTTDQTGRARFVVTSEPGPFLATIVGTEVRASTVIVTEKPSASAATVIAACPREVTRTQYFTIAGTNFRGDADDNRVSLGGAPALVLASSPDSLEVWPAQTMPLGPADLQVAEPTSKAATNVDVVELRIERRAAASTAPGAMQPGKSQELIVHVEGSATQTPLAVLNLSPGIIELVGGAFQRVTSSGGKPNEAHLQIHTVHPGDVSVSVLLAVRAGTARDANAAKRALERARVAADVDWAARVDGALERLNNEPGRPDVVIADIERMLEQNPPQQVARHLETAWIELAP